MDRYRRHLFAVILAGLVLSISPTRSGLAHGVERPEAGVQASAAPVRGDGGAGLTAPGPWRDRDVFIPVRRDNRSGSGRGPLPPLAVIAVIVTAGLGGGLAGSRRARSRLTADSLRSRAPPAAAFLLLP